MLMTIHTCYKLYMFVQELIKVVFISHPHIVNKGHVQKVTTTVDNGLSAFELGGRLLHQYNYGQFEHLSVIFGSSACLCTYITFQQCLEHKTFELSARTDSSVQMTVQLMVVDGRLNFANGTCTQSVQLHIASTTCTSMSPYFNCSLTPLTTI